MGCVLGYGKNARSPRVRVGKLWMYLAIVAIILAGFFLGILNFFRK